jgi:prephenate dehydratase
MAKRIRKVNYYVLHAANRPGTGVQLLKTLKKHGVSLLALSAFPAEHGSQVDLVPEDSRALLALAKKEGWKLSARKTGFLAQGKDRAGALVKLTETLATARINITAIDAVAAGGSRYAAIFWVPPKDVARAAKLLGAK